MIEASFDPKKTNAASVAGAVQYDKGQRLLLRGLPDPEEMAEKDEFLSGDGVTVQVQYAYEGEANTESRLAQYDEGEGGWVVDVPDKYLTKNYPVGFFVYVSYGTDEERQRSKTMYTGAFTPKARPAPGDQVTPDQINAWDKYVAEVQLAISNTNAATSGALAAANSANDAAAAANAATKKANEAFDAIKGYEFDSVKTVNGAKPDEAGNVTVKVGVNGASEGHVPVFDANGDIVSSGKSFWAFTRVKMTLTDDVLTITTVK